MSAVYDAAVPRQTAACEAQRPVQAIDMEAIRSAGRGLFTVEGMWCPSCAAATERIMAGVPGVTRVRVNYETASALVDWAPEVADLGALVAKVRALGYRLGPPRAAAETARQIDRNLATLQMRLAVAVFFAAWVMALSLARYAQPDALGSGIVGERLGLAVTLLAIPVLLMGIPIIVAGWRTLRAGVPGMDTLVALGALGAMALSAGQLWRGSGHVYADTAAMLIVLLTLGRLIEMVMVRRTALAIASLEEGLPERARMIVADRIVVVPAGEVSVGTRIELAAGARVPLDGVIVAGESTLDRSLLTGESVPVPVRPGDRCEAGTINLDTPLILRVTASVGTRRIDHIGGQIAQMRGDKSALQRLADRAARWIVPFALLAAAVAFVLSWVAGGPLVDAAMRAISVLVIACPCAVAVAVPMGFLTGAGRAARDGVLFRSPAALETLGQCCTLMLDKTGTLTNGTPSVVGVECAPGTEATVRALAAAAESGIDHPIARALATDATLPAGLVRTRRARGVVATDAEGGTILVGSAAFLREDGVKVPQVPCGEVGTIAPVDVAHNGVWLGRIRFSDVVRKETVPAVAQLRGQGIAVAVVSGDLEGPVDAVAAALDLGPGAVHAQCTPEDKAELVVNARAHGLVAFAGDGVNDTIALAAADVGIAVDGAAHAANATADVLVTKGGVAGIGRAFSQARRARSRMVQNLAFAVAYNALALPLAFFGMVPPIAAAAAMVASSVTVIANSQRP